MSKGYTIEDQIARWKQWASPPFTLGGWLLMLFALAIFLAAGVGYWPESEIGRLSVTVEMWSKVICATIVFAAGFLARRVRKE